MIKCSCAVTEEIKEATKAANKAEYNREKARKTSTKESMKRKCYDIEVGDTIRIKDHVEGTIEAEVTGMIWIEEGGFREPDGIEVTWNDREGTRREGDLEMQEVWDRVQDKIKREEPKETGPQQKDGDQPEAKMRSVEGEEPEGNEPRERTSKGRREIAEMGPAKYGTDVKKRITAYINGRQNITTTTTKAMPTK